MYKSCCKCLEDVEHPEEEEEEDQAGELDEEDLESVRLAQLHMTKSAWARPRLSRDQSRDTAWPADRDDKGHAVDGPVAGAGDKKKSLAYHSRGAKKELLRSSYLNSRVPIYECHEECSCLKEVCPNRVVERGRKVPLQVFRTTDNRGWGVRTMREIKRGQFVDCYLGEVIRPEEAERRRHNSSKTQRKDVYLFALDKFTDPQSVDYRLQGAPLEVDGEFMSGPTRFINHSCDPNLRIFARVGDQTDKHIHDLALFAIHDIGKGEELTFDYVDGQGEIESNARDEKLQEEMTRCLCGSNQCRGYLW
jgi:[histone H3]-lysine9 N-trimethyltransferase SUV39H